MTIIVHFAIEHQVYYDSKFKEQHAKIWENIAGPKRYSRPRGFNIAGASVPSPPSIPTPLALGLYPLANRILSYDIGAYQMT